MRIIGGEAKSKKLMTPKGENTRPTLDKVKESLFNILQFRMINVCVLDLFSGSGALALESISRGAKEAVLVEMNRNALEAIRRNIEFLCYQEKTTVLPLKWEKALIKISDNKMKFDIIFIDPPYDMQKQEKIFETILKKETLHNNGMIVYEHDCQMKLPSMEGLRMTDQRKYGDTMISFYQKA